MSILGRLFLVDVPESLVPYVVPVEAWTGYVGPDFAQRLAEKLGDRYQRDPEDIGLMDDLESLSGPHFDVARVNPLVREFYEHTSRFTLSLTPHWRWTYLPAFWLFRKLFAQEVDQLNIPFDVKEAQQGVESHIDAVEAPDKPAIYLRAWVRTFAGTSTVIYCGIYTTVRHGDAGFVSVGFPLPWSNMTSTLRPENVAPDGMMLRTDSKESFVGDYLSLVDDETKRLSVTRIAGGFHQHIHVFVQDGSLQTNHRFFFLGTNFLTLHYTMQRKSGTKRPIDVRAAVRNPPTAQRAGQGRRDHQESAVVLDAASGRRPEGVAERAERSPAGTSRESS